MITTNRDQIKAAVSTGVLQAEAGGTQQIALHVIDGPLAVTFAMSTLDPKLGKVRATQMTVDDTAIFAVTTTAAMADLARRTTIAAKRVATLILKPNGDTSTIVVAQGATPILSVTTEVQ